jgi:hypothetical protein
MCEGGMLWNDGRIAGSSENVGGETQRKEKGEFNGTSTSKTQWIKFGSLYPKFLH